MELPRGPAEVWTRAERSRAAAPPREAASRFPAPKVDAREENEPIDAVEILVAMGFDRPKAQAAMRRCSSVDAAVELMMSGRLRVPGGAGIAADQASMALADAGAAAAAGLESFFKAFSPWWSTEPAPAELPAAPVAPEEPLAKVKEEEAADTRVNAIYAMLKALGYSEEEASSATLHCSTVPEAVEWLSRAKRNRPNEMEFMNIR